MTKTDGERPGWESGKTDGEKAQKCWKHFCFLFFSVWIVGGMKGGWSESNSNVTALQQNATYLFGHGSMRTQHVWGDFCPIAQWFSPTWDPARKKRCRHTLSPSTKSNCRCYKSPCVCWAAVHLNTVRARTGTQREPEAASGSNQRPPCWFTHIQWKLSLAI